jgi:hypothetical protein
VPILCSANPFASPSAPDNPHQLADRSLGLDLVGPLKKAPEGYMHLLVAVNRFSKWIEARPITKIKSKQAVLFFHDIIH